MKKYIIVVVILGGILFFFFQNKQGKEDVYREGVVENTEKEVAGGRSVEDDANEIDKEEGLEEVSETNDTSVSSGSLEEDVENAEKKVLGESGENDNQELDQGKEAVITDEETYLGRTTTDFSIQVLETSGLLFEDEVVGYRSYYYEPDRYEGVAKEQAQYLIVNLTDENEEPYVGATKVFEINDESLVYLLSAHTNYFRNGKDIKSLDYRFEVPHYQSIYDHIEEGHVVVSDNKFFVFMAEDKQKVDHFISTFEQAGNVSVAFDEYLESGKGKGLLNSVTIRLDEQMEKIKAAGQGVPSSFKEVGKRMWDAFLVLDLDGLRETYAKQLWFFSDQYVDDAWLDDSKKENILNQAYSEKDFYLIEREVLLDAYKEHKTEEFEELLSEMQNVEKDITFYYIEDLMKICNGEDKNEFMKYVKAEPKDVVMFVEVTEGNNNICTINGEFSFDDKFFWLLREVEGGVQVVTDYNE